VSAPAPPVTLETCAAEPGPFFHGTRAALDPGALITAGHPSNYEAGRTSRHVYFSALLEPAAWGAELAVARAGDPGPGFVYEAEPTGPFEDDPNLTDKRFPGNPTRSFRSRAPLRVRRALPDWPRHPPEQVAAMLAAIDEKQRRGEAPIED
jgi:rifampin ADP-ribosylating transferase